MGNNKEAKMKTHDNKISETPKPRALSDPQITRADIMALAGWQNIKREETYLVNNKPKL
jgi:hypothetical protein